MEFTESATNEAVYALGYITKIKGGLVETAGRWENRHL